MSEHLQNAKSALHSLATKMKGERWSKEDDLATAIEALILHLETQQETLASASQPTEQPAPSSSEATETAEETSDTSSGSWSWSFLANPDGSLMWSVRRDILDWLNSLRLHGSEAEGEIGVTLTSKASTPPTGSASPSTEEPTPEVSGVAGSYDMGPFLEADGYPDSPASSPEEEHR